MPALSPPDERFMRLALALGARHLGMTWPNPSVGAVVGRERDGRSIVGQGITQPGGRPHAERLALAEAGEAARGATLYVTLEPCSAAAAATTARPAPMLIVAAGIRRVVIGARDPDPSRHGDGYPRLRGRRHRGDRRTCLPTRPAAPIAATSCASPRAGRA